MNHEYEKVAMIEANASMLRAFDRYDSKAHRAAMHAALDSLVQYVDMVRSFSNDYPYSEHIWKELGKVSEYVEHLKWDYHE